MDNLTLKAYAKINLALDVLRKRPDGYHDVRMIMQSIQLHDKLMMKKTVSPSITITTNLTYLPSNEGNIVHTATKLFKETFHIDNGVFIQLEKRIPVSAGLAGGSADAAATLIGLNELFDTKLSLKELQSLGVEIGADVPFCLLRGIALSEGIGDILTPLSQSLNYSCLIVKPNVNVSTKYVYEHLELDDTIKHPNIDAMITAIEQNNHTKIMENLSNVLETVTLKNYPEISEIKAQMLILGACGSLMSGSGPTVFGLFQNHKLAQKAFYEFKIGKYGKQTFLTRLNFA